MSDDGTGEEPLKFWGWVDVAVGVAVVAACFLPWLQGRAVTKEFGGRAVDLPWAGWIPVLLGAALVIVGIFALVGRSAPRWVSVGLCSMAGVIAAGALLVTDVLGPLVPQSLLPKGVRKFTLTLQSQAGPWIVLLVVLCVLMLVAFDRVFPLATRSDELRAAMRRPTSICARASVLLLVLAVVATRGAVWVSVSGPAQSFDLPVEQLQEYVSENVTTIDWTLSGAELPWVGSITFALTLALILVSIAALIRPRISMVVAIGAIAGSLQLIIGLVYSISHGASSSLPSFVLERVFKNGDAQIGPEPAAAMMFLAATLLLPTTIWLLVATNRERTLLQERPDHAEAHGRRGGGLVAAIRDMFRLGAAEPEELRL